MSEPRELRPRLTNVFREVFDDDALEVTDATSADDIDAWDSLKHITLILAVEREFSIRISAAEAGLLANVGELCKLIVARGGK
jgi:acyl carrier protein